ncbi:MAG: ribonuclease H-like domain-containing protein [Candidatus Omnitrophica bacterium]|jgi:hypothetical protein|nr:ribonuclease H-like domain-containing protein [Candidatus Omnitrophota bacterium]
MTLENIKEFLQNNPGYLKWGDVRIALKLDTDIDLVKQAKLEVKNVAQDEVNSGPNILILDIETAPLMSYTFGIWQQNISLDQIESDFFIITWSAKWLGSDKVFNGLITPKEILNEDDSSIMKQLWLVLEKADIVIGHNFKRFDKKKINSRFIENGLGPVSPYKVIDTLEVVKRNFGFTSNKLEALARKFGFESKHDTGFNLWKACMKGDREALIKMSLYCDHDVEITENVFFKLLPWIKDLNLGLYNIDDEIKCPACGSNQLKEAGFHYTSISKYQSYRCEECGHISRDRHSILTRDENKKIIVSVK